MDNYEKLGAFYLGREYDPDSETVATAPLLYDAKDLTTHAVIIGMTGSGKTGLGVSLLEEAAIDRIPVIAIDPKGDLGNLALTFPKLAAEDFEPWVDRGAALSRGQSVSEFAAAQAGLWEKGLADWGQDGDRIARLRAAADVAVYTPGASSGRPLSILGALSAPPEGVDQDTRIQRLQATVTGLLNLAGVDADPVSSREHILLSHIIQHAWARGESPDLAALVRAIQKPPFEQIGILALNDFYPDAARFGLAMRFNNLLASPGFAAWTQGEPLAARQLLYTEQGAPRVSVINIAHLSDDERMFVVTLLLGEILTWMRAQPGTGSLRAVLYFDELFGFMPPNGNPASKALLLTLLKQARAFGLGLVLSTQNPVDLDYKGLSNAGTWFIGRLQTPQDRERVLDGLLSASGGVERKTLDNWLGSLGKRRFLLHNVHDSAPVLFATRWAMSYLAGPMSREQIARLAATARPQVTVEDKPPPAAPAIDTPARAAPARERPVLDRTIKQYFLPAGRDWLLADEAQRAYRAHALALVDVGYTNARAKVAEQRRILLAAPVDDGPVSMEWSRARELPQAWIDELLNAPDGAAAYMALPGVATQASSWSQWGKALSRHVRLERPLELLCCTQPKAQSVAGESEAEFRIRLQQLLSEERDSAVAKLRVVYDKRTARLRERLLSAEQRVEKESTQARQKKLDAAMSFGSVLLGAFLGRKALSRSNVNRASTAVRRAGRISKEAEDVRHAQVQLEALREELAQVAAEFEQEIAKLDVLNDAQALPLETLEIRAKSADIRVHFVALGWMPERLS